MGIGDFTSKVLTEYKADTKQHRRELKKLSKEQQEQAKKAIEAAEKQNDAIDSQIAMLGKAALAIGAVTAAYKVGEAGIEAYQKRSRLNSATVGADIKGLQNATKGLVSETRLLEFASKAMNGTFKLSQKQMEQALQGAVALRKTLGVDLTKALEVTQKAITEGTTEPLKELGLVVKGVENDTREGLTAALSELANQARLAGPDMAIPGDEMARSQVKMADAVDNLKIALGKLVVALGPVIEKLARMVQLVAEAADIAFSPDRNVGDLMNRARRQLRGRSLGDTERGMASRRTITETGYEAVGEAPKEFGPFLSYGEDQARLKQIEDERKRRLAAAKKAAEEAAKKLDKEIAEAIRRTTELDLDDRTSSTKAGDLYRGGLMREAAEFRGQTSDALSGASTAIKQAIEAAKMFEEMRAREKSGIIASVFGTPTEIDATAEALMNLTTGFDGLANAFGAGVDALITGSDSFANAFKKAIAESLRSMAVDMSVRALREAAMGLGELALGNLPAAAMHGKAAAAYGLGAVAAGVAARGLGAGGSNVSTPRTAGSAGVGAASGGGPSNDNGKTNVFIVGNDFAGMNARQREAMWRQTSRSAGVQIEGDVVING